MPDPVDNEDLPKNYSWIILVAVFAVLVAIGALTS